MSFSNDLIKSNSIYAISPTNANKMSCTINIKIRESNIYIYIY